MRRNRVSGLRFMASDAPLGPQTAGAAGGVIPFWAAAQETVFDGWTSSAWTPGASVVDLFQGALADVKAYGYLNRLWLKLVGASGSGAGTFATDAPMNAFSIFRFMDPNGHAIIDADSFGLYLLNKYGGDTFNGSPVDLPSSNVAIGGTTGVATPQFTLYVPFCINPEIGLGALSDMDASGPYQIYAQGNTSAAIYSTNPASTIPTITATVGGEFFSLPAQASRVNGQPQVFLPPLLDRGLAVVMEFTKQKLTNLASNVPTNLRRVGNIISQIYLVARDTNGLRTLDWATGGQVLSSGARLQFSFDGVPLWDIDPVHAIDMQYRRRARGLAKDTGVLVIDRHASAGLALNSLGVDAGLDKLLQTAQNSDLTLQTTWGSVNTIDVYTLDVSVTNLVTGEKYSFAYGGQLLMPNRPSVRG